MNSSKFKYHFLRYNRYFSLKPSPLLIGISLYFVKDFFIVLVIGASAFKARGASDEITNLIDLASPKMVFASIPILILAYAWIHRNPEAGNFVRWIWQRGQYFILAAAIINSTLILSSSWPTNSISLTTLLTVLSLNIVAICYVFRSEEVCDTFADFPENNESKKTEPEIL